jgi:preprotein translocase subunit Sss1
MDEKLRKIIEQKIDSTFEKRDEIKNIVHSLDELSSQKNSFALGIIIGRLYNSFYYQCRRILKRDPTEKEFSEFLEILKKRKFEFLKKIP